MSTKPRKKGAATRLRVTSVAAIALLLGACASKTPKPAARKTAVKSTAANKQSAQAKKKNTTAAKKKTAAKTTTSSKVTVVKPTPAVGKSGFKPDAEILVCPKMKVSNRPRTDRNRKVLAYKPFVKVNKVSLAVAPQNGACFSSGFGPRRGKPHKGIDFYAKPGPMIHAAAAGTIKEAQWHDGYGKMVVIDHGNDVYTRYAHLARFNRGIKVGKKVAFGDPLGPMGKTSKYKVAIHLHYEVLTGAYHPRKKSFGLKPVNIMKMLR